jgi:hypothetical protein
MAKNTAELKINFVKRENSPDSLIAEAEVILPAPFDGLKLVGFSVWNTAKGGFSVTFPSRAFGAGSERKFFDFLRYVDNADAAKTFKARILEAYKEWSGKNSAAA